MKNSIIAITLGLCFAGACLSSCDTPAENVVDAKADLQEAQLKLAEAHRDSIKDAEWDQFKAASIEKITNNNIKIVELKGRQYVKGAYKDPSYEKQVIILEERNLLLQRRIDDYEKYNSNWEEFKREFNHDVEEIGKSLKEITVDNSK